MLLQPDNLPREVVLRGPQNVIVEELLSRAVAAVGADSMISKDNNIPGYYGQQQLEKFASVENRSQEFFLHLQGRRLRWKLP